MALLISILVAAIFNSIVIWIVAKLGMGLDVSSFGAAFLAALVIAIVGGLVHYFLGPTFGKTVLWTIIINLVVAAVILLIAGAITPGFRARGFGGALIGAIAIAVVQYLLGLAIVAVMGESFI